MSFLVRSYIPAKIKLNNKPEIYPRNQFPYISGLYYYAVLFVVVVVSYVKRKAGFMMSVNPKKQQNIINNVEQQNYSPMQNGASTLTHIGVVIYIMLASDIGKFAMEYT